MTLFGRKVTKKNSNQDVSFPSGKIYLENFSGLWSEPSGHPASYSYITYPHYKIRKTTRDEDSFMHNRAVGVYIFADGYYGNS